MNKLTILNENGQLVTDSREVSEMVGKQHKDLLESIRGYIKYLISGNFRPSDFFIESNYIDGANRNKPCYLLTKKGCDMVANKMTGEKGVLFTAEYVTRFEEMERDIKNPMKNLSKELVSRINDIAVPVRIMHVSGSHEHAIMENGIRSLLPEEVEIVAGPGCPVCVVPSR